MSLLILLRKENLDILYSRNPIFCFLVLPFRKWSNSLVVYEVNGIFLEEQLMLSSNRNSKSKISFIKTYFFNKLYGLIEMISLKYSDVVISVTPKIKEFLISKGIQNHKIHVIENGANVELFKPYDKKEFLDKSGLDAHQRYVCFVGNLAPWQGVEYLIEASVDVIKKTNTKFLIIGDGILRQKLEDMVNDFGVTDYFLFIGKVPYNLVPFYINASQLCVVPKVKSLSSGYSPLKLYEYLACGKPVIATNTFGFEFLEKSNSGILIDPEDSIEFSNAILKLLNSNELREKMGRNGLNYVRRGHSWKNVAEKTVHIINSFDKQ